MPLVLAIYDYCYIQPGRYATLDNSRPTWLRRITHGQARYLLPTAILSGVSMYTSMNTDALRSTYICPQFASAPRVVPVLQFLAALADCYFLVSIETIARRRATNAAIPSYIAPLLIGSTFVVCSCLGCRYLSLTLQSSLLPSSFWVVLSLSLPTQDIGSGCFVLTMHTLKT